MARKQSITKMLIFFLQTSYSIQSFLHMMFYHDTEITWKNIKEGIIESDVLESGN